MTRSHRLCEQAEGTDSLAGKAGDVLGGRAQGDVLLAGASLGAARPHLLSDSRRLSRHLCQLSTCQSRSECAGSCTDRAAKKPTDKWKTQTHRSGGEKTCQNHSIIIFDTQTILNLLSRSPSNQLLCPFDYHT